MPSSNKRINLTVPDSVLTAVMQLRADFPAYTFVPDATLFLALATLGIQKLYDDSFRPPYDVRQSF